MKKTLLLSVVASTMIMAGGDIAPVAPVETAAPASTDFLIFNNITANGEIRPRYEYVDDSKSADTASAFTNRLTIGVGADLLQVDGLSVYLEATNVTGSDDFFDTTSDDASDKGQYPVVADPDQTHVLHKHT